MGCKFMQMQFQVPFMAAVYLNDFEFLFPYHIILYWYLEPPMLIVMGFERQVMMKFHWKIKYCAVYMTRWPQKAKHQPNILVPFDVNLI